ncbi:SDR family oxidoreductase [Hyphococcus sp.]|uniref:SDR family oxidoreductase n=1 Tax=Hyphococcus sp. TaxID=2038636 RepID=UPI003CCB8321
MPTVVVTGANRGIGLECVKQYAADGWKVHALCRRPEKAAELEAVSGAVEIHAADVMQHASINETANGITDPVDVLIANAGVHGKAAGEFGALEYDVWRSVIETNVFGAVATAEAFAQHVKKAKGKIAFISSKMGSIGDASGGGMAYRTSKTALNMAAKVIAAALAGDDIAVAPFHPGWVETDMGGPNALIDTGESVSGLRNLIGEMTVTASPKFLSYDGAEIEW